MTSCRTPVVLFVFNRPDQVRRLLAVLRVVRPATLLLVADGPRPDQPSDAERCLEVRQLLERIDWPCEVLRDYSETNQGCDPRVTAGIDWAFQQVEDAILLEDDVLPHPSFFSWCTEMLERYRDSDTVHCVSGRNVLGRWREADGDHHLMFRGSNWGCATWRRAWQQACAVSLPGPDETIPRLLADARIDPLVASQLEMFRGIASIGALRGWDSRWELQRGLLGTLSAVPPVNLVAHAGFGGDATHKSDTDSLLALQPVDRPPEPTGRMKETADHQLDRWSLLIELLDTYRDPRVIRLLAKSQALPMDQRVRQHLAPFIAAGESLGALRHLRATGASSARLDTFIAALESLAAQSDDTSLAS